MTPRENVHAIVVLTGLPAVLPAAVALAPPHAAPFLCAALMGASVTAVAFALTGWNLLPRRTDGRDRTGGTDRTDRRRTDADDNDGGGVLCAN